MKKIIQFFRWLFGIKPKPTAYEVTVKWKPEKPKDDWPKLREEPKKLIEQPKKKHQTLLFKKQQLEGKLYHYQRKLIRIEKRIPSNNNKFKYQISYL